MPDYSKTSIYKLCCNDPTIEEIYIGSTCNFHRRKAHHKTRCNNEMVGGYNTPVYKFIRDNGGFQNWSMFQLVEKSVENKREKETLEREWIEKLKPQLNSYIPTRNGKEYRDDNKEKISEKGKKYYENNKELIIEKTKEYREKNKEQISEKDKIRSKIYRETNKEKLNEKSKEWREKRSEKNKEKFNCDCGGKYTHQGKSTHFKRKIHTDYLETKV
jgi:hypothetical protein